jgi:hypothetical protein
MRTLNAELAATKNLVFANNAFARTDLAATLLVITRR